MSSDSSCQTITDDEYNYILLRSRIDEATKMVLSLYPDSHLFSKRYILKTLSLVDNYLSSHTTATEEEE